MPKQPFQQWICDRCNKVINSAGEGYFEWLCTSDVHNHGFRIVHQTHYSPNQPSGECYHYTNDPNRSDLALSCLVGPAGIVKLLSMVDVGPHHDPDYNGHRVGDFREFTEIFRRLHIPYYEEARLYWNSAHNDGFFNGMNEIQMYLPDTLQTLIRKYEPSEDSF